MKKPAWKLATIFLLALSLALFCSATVLAKQGGGKPNPTTAGNNLSYPVIWAEGVTKTLPGTPGMTPTLTGVYWYQWGTAGTEPDAVPMSCAPDPDDELLCDDGVVNTADGPSPGDTTGFPIPLNLLPLVKAFVQKDAYNTWQAESDDWSGAPVEVHWIDWGDNLESVDWYTKSQVRTEVVLFQDLAALMLEYEMRHVSGWGIDEVHGLAADPLAVPPVAIQGPGTRATVYSPCARLTIQKLLVDRDDPRLPDLFWDATMSDWTEPAEDPNIPGDPYPDDLINPPIFNKAVHEAQDGPGYYNAEINVKGRIIYGYTWNVRRLNEGAGDYRITFSFDDTCGGTTINTFFVDGVTEIILPLEEDVAAAAAEEGESPEGGAVGVLDFGNNLTYMDVRILERGGGGGGNGGGKKPAKTK